MAMTAQDTKSKPGYKQTKVGVIPEDWEVSKVGIEFEIKLGKMLDVEKNIGVPKSYIGNKAVQWNRIDISDLQTIAMSRSDLERFRLRRGDLLVCEGGEVGRAAIWEAPIEECYYQKALHRLRPLRGFNSRLMLGLLQYWTEHRMLADYVSQTSIAHLTREKFIEVPMPVPTSDEQRAIVATLSDVDALIASLDRLIAKKRDIKQATMQQLLTGKTRLPGFSEEWRVKKLGEVVEIKKGQLITESMCIPGNIPVIAGGKQPAYFHNKPNRLKNTITVSASGANAGYISLYEIPIFASDCSTIEEGNTYSIRYIYYQLQLLQEKIYKMQSGGAQPHIHPRDLFPIEIQLSNIDEQQAIVTVLSDMDAEIVALEQKREKTRTLKQGMMQELLTGKTRLL